MTNTKRLYFVKKNGKEKEVQYKSYKWYTARGWELKIREVPCFKNFNYKF